MLAIHMGIILDHSSIRIIYFEETQTRISLSLFAVNASINLSNKPWTYICSKGIFGGLTFGELIFGGA